MVDRPLYWPELIDRFCILLALHQLTESKIKGRGKSLLVDWAAHKCDRGIQMGALYFVIDTATNMGNREPAWIPNRVQKHIDDKTCIDTTLRWEEPHLGGLLEFAGEHMTKGNARHASPDMLKKNLLMCIGSTDSLDLAKQEPERALIGTKPSEMGALATNRVHTQTNIHSSEADLIQIFIKMLEGRHVC